MNILKSDIEQLVKQKLVSVQKHPTQELFIYNYTPIVQYHKLWTETLKQCRGLILDKDNNVIARGFQKFFNIEEHTQEEIPSESFEVFEKLDGSLGICYYIGDMPFIATRGSFTSEQAIKANELLHNKYKHLHGVLKEMHNLGTPLFEIIYPENRIVCDYGKEEKLILLGIVDRNDHTKFYDVEPFGKKGFSVATKFNGITDLYTLREKEEDNKEGFVIRFKSGFMVKAKYKEYCRLHRILTQVSSRVIWKLLKDGDSLEVIIEKVPDEFYDWFKETKNEIIQNYDSIEQSAITAFNKIQSGIPLLMNYKDRRKEFAKVAFEHYKDIQGILFTMLDLKDYSKVIWDMVYPEYEKPFKKEE